MIVDFTVENFRSIKDMQTLSMLATAFKEHPKNTFLNPNPNDKEFRLLRTAGIYGANASGKSNVLRAIETFVSFVKNSTEIKVDEKIKYFDPFKLDKNTIFAPTKFELEFINIDKIRYRYGFSFTEDEVVEEHLYFYPKGYETNLFLREKNKPIEFGQSLTGDKKIIERQLLKNNLYLSKAANSNHKQLKGVYQYFDNILILCDKKFFFDVNPLLPFVDLTHYDTPKDFVDKFIKIADVGIEKVEYERNDSKSFESFVDFLKKDNSFTEEQIEKLKHKPTAIHKVFDRGNETGETVFKIEDESEGTQKLYRLCGVLFHAMKNNSILIMDELNNSFHPYITQFLLKLFHSNKARSTYQFIFATHDVSILNLDIFRRDQIWFTEKDAFGSTNLYSLGEFKKSEIRKKTPIDKWYLSGRFGALPLVGSVRNLLEYAETTKK